MHERRAPRGWERLNEVEVEVLRPTRRKIGHFGDVFFQPVSWNGTEEDGRV